MNQTQTQTQTQNQKNNQNSTTHSYSKVVSNSMYVYPKKDQAIVTDSVDKARIEDYLEAIVKKIKPEFIVAASKITQNRFCCYLNNAQLVEKLTQEGNNELEICGTKVTMRPYVARLKRIIFSNLHPCIPNQVILDKLTEFEVVPKSNMTFLRVGADNPAFAHIVCFRRQIYVEPEEIEKLPDDFIIKHEDTSYHIYVTTDKMTCFQCKQDGHTTKFCPLNNQQTQSQTQYDLVLNQNIHSHSHSENKEASSSTSEPTAVTASAESAQIAPQSANVNTVNTDITSAEANNNNNMQFNGQNLFAAPSFKNENKRTRSNVSTSSISSQAQATKKNSQHITPPVKKQKAQKLSTDVINDEINAAKIEIPNTVTSTFPITFEQLKKIIETSTSMKYREIPSEIIKYTVDHNGLTTMFNEVNKKISNIALKTRLTKIINAVKVSTEEGAFMPDDTSGDSDAV